MAKTRRAGTSDGFAVVVKGGGFTAGLAQKDATLLRALRIKEIRKDFFVFENDVDEIPVRFAKIFWRLGLCQCQALCST